jgi:hypothetical protein
MSLASSAGRFENLSKSEIFDLLRNKRRRYLLHYMKQAEKAELGDLATRIAAWEYGEAVETVSSDQRKRVYTTLQQTHLPRMNEADIVDYDADRGVVRRTEHTDKLNVYLEVVPRNEFPWREYYLSLGAVSLGLGAAVWADVTPFTTVPDVTWVLLVATVLTLSAAVHVYREHSMRLGAEEIPAELDGR